MSHISSINFLLTLLLRLNKYWKFNSPTRRLPEIKKKKEKSTLPSNFIYMLDCLRLSKPEKNLQMIFFYLSRLTRNKFCR